MRNSAALLVGRQRRQRQSVHPAFQFVGQSFVDLPLPRHTPHAGKSRGDERHREMRLAALPGAAGMTRMTGMPCRIVNNI